MVNTRRPHYNEAAVGVMMAVGFLAPMVALIIIPIGVQVTELIKKDVATKELIAH